MLQKIEGFWMEAYMVGTSGYIQEYHHGPLPPGTNVYATIALSEYQLLTPRDDTRPSSIFAYISSWTVYEPDGTISGLIPADQGQNQTAAGIQNCATITFLLAVQNGAGGGAQINIFTF